MRYSYYDQYMWLEMEKKLWQYVGICHKMRKQVGIRNGFQSLQYFSLCQSHKCAQNLIQGHKLDMVGRFCIPHSTKRAQNFKAWANCVVHWTERGVAEGFTPLESCDPRWRWGQFVSVPGHI